MSDPAGRHTPVSTLVEYLNHGTQGAFQVQGIPEAVLILDPASRSLGLRFPASGGIPDVTELSHVGFEPVLEGATLWYVLTVKFDEDFSEVYALLCSIADRVQLGGEAFSTAVSATLENLEAILERRAVPTVEQQVGLAGELLVFHALAAQHGLEAAAGSWLGPAGEEHDFRLGDIDLEVKTTLGERRVHWISTLTQLVPTMNRPLYLVSIQLTRAGASDGWTLPEVVDRIREFGGPQELFESRLKGTAYSERARDLLTGRWSLRTAPAVYAVQGAFPAVTRERLASAVPMSELVLDARYQIDVGSLPQVNVCGEISERVRDEWA